jgi:D-beta-D-heptose 7-phosphate kinase/D-beta-D-heptose 1-phosphate adenosyltransferase
MPRNKLADSSSTHMIRVPYSVARAIVYGELFSYPLPVEDVDRFAISPRKNERTFLVEKTDRFLHRKGKSFLVDRYKKRIAESNRKYIHVLRIARALSWIPGIWMCGISGSLARNNAEKDDDIDLFIITAPGTLWTTRGIVLLLLGLMRKKRTPSMHQSKDTICINFWRDGRYLRFEPERQHVYTATEMIQLVPLVDKHDTYARWIRTNTWLSRWYTPQATSAVYRPRATMLERVMIAGFRMMNPLMELFQRWYMRSRQTSEKVESQSAAFHPDDYAPRICAAYDRLIRKLRLQVIDRG